MSMLKKAEMPKKLATSEAGNERTLSIRTALKN